MNRQHFPLHKESNRRRSGESGICSPFRSQPYFSRPSSIVEGFAFSRIALKSLARKNRCPGPEAHDQHKSERRLYHQSGILLLWRLDQRLFRAFNIQYRPTYDALGLFQALLVLVSSWEYCDSCVFDGALLGTFEGTRPWERLFPPATAHWILQTPSETSPEYDMVQEVSTPNT